MMTDDNDIGWFGGRSLVVGRCASGVIQSSHALGFASPPPLLTVTFVRDVCAIRPSFIVSTIPRHTIARTKHDEVVLEQATISIGWVEMMQLLKNSMIL
jgi:hypothetical protein